MADITMCQNNECGLRETCYRYIAVPNRGYQPYMYDPNGDCVEKKYEMFVKVD